MFNKRGQELSTGTIILLIVGVIILVVLALGFTSGWSKLFPFLSKTNVEQIRTSCNAICTENSAEAYCLSAKSLTSETGEKLKDVTCYYLASKSLYGIEGCGIDCSSKAIIVDNLNKENKVMTATDLITSCNNYAGKTIQYMVYENDKGTSQRLVSYSCPAAAK